MTKSEELFEHWEAIIACIGDIVNRKVAEEREACAKIVDEARFDGTAVDLRSIAIAIRTRGQ